MPSYCPITDNVCSSMICPFYNSKKDYCLLVNFVNPASGSSLPALLKRIGDELEEMNNRQAGRHN